MKRNWCRMSGLISQRAAAYTPRILALCAWMSCAMLVGCGEAGIEGLRSVTGTVTYQGQPVEGAMISFIGEGSARPATAVSQAGGKYELFTLDSKGAFPGKYTVTVVKTDAPSEAANKDPGIDASGRDLSMEQAAASAGKATAAPKDLVPAKYGAAGTSPLKMEVKDSDDNVLDLKLE